MTPKKLLRIVTPSNGRSENDYLEIFGITGFPNDRGTLSGMLDLYRFEETMRLLGITTIKEFVDTFKYEKGVKKMPVYVNSGKDFDDINLLAYKPKGEIVKKQPLSKQQSEQVFANVTMDDLPF